MEPAVSLSIVMRPCKCVASGRVCCHAMRMDESWWDCTAAWWAKAERALTHIQNVGEMAAAFEQSPAYQIRHEVPEPGRVLATFHVLKPMPVQLLTAIGDALHNLRSSLDSMAYELARRHLGDQMTERQQSATRFPICKDKADFDKFLNDGRRRDLWGEREQNTLRCVQPFALREEAGHFGVAFATPPEEEFRIHALARLSHLNNLDKHRRLPLLAWSAEIIYMTGDTNECMWVRASPVRSMLRDGDMVGEATYPPDRSSPSVAAEIKLALAEDFGYTQGLVSSLKNWHGYLTGWVLPRMFAVADGNPPPMMIVNRQPY